MPARAWLFKTEPDHYSIDDLKRDGTTHWDGVRNYQARNLLRDEVVVGDDVLVYHSQVKPMGVAGVGRVVRRGYPDHTAWTPGSKYPDPRSTPETPVWFMVDIAFVARWPRILDLARIKADAKLSGMMVSQRGARLSIQPVERKHFDRCVKMAETAAR